MAIQAIKILTVRFGESLQIGVIEGGGTLNCAKVTQIMIHEIVRYQTKAY